MLSRRTFLTTSTLAFSQLLLGCGQSRSQALQVRLLKGSIPAQILKAFQRQKDRESSLEFLQGDQLADLFKLLETWKNPGQKQPGFALPMGDRSLPVADLVTLGDFWLPNAIQQGLIQPIEWELQWKWFNPEWLDLVRRDDQGNPAPNSKIWAAPYRWGTLMIAYQPEKFKSLGWTPKDWSDLWRPELKGHVSLLDSPRSVIGLTLKKLKQSANADLDTVPTLAAELAALHQQVKFYSSDAYLQPLSLGDTWATVGWSNEILTTVERDRSLAAVVPASGTLLTADLWVRPATAQTTLPQIGKLMDWINFCWEPEIAAQLSLLSNGTAPLFKGSQFPIPSTLKDKPLRLPSSEVLDRSGARWIKENCAVRSRLHLNYSCPLRLKLTEIRRQQLPLVIKDAGAVSKILRRSAHLIQEGVAIDVVVAIPNLLIHEQIDPARHLSRGRFRQPVVQQLTAELLPHPPEARSRQRRLRNRICRHPIRIGRRHPLF
jgi:putative spermidine/putrescine transport system substrate-binding protein